MSNEIDELMSLDPLSLTKPDLKAIVAYHRNHRAQSEMPKGKRAATEPKPTINAKDFIAQMLNKKTVESVVNEVTGIDKVVPPKPSTGLRRL